MLVSQHLIDLFQSKTLLRVSKERGNKDDRLRVAVQEGEQVMLMQCVVLPLDLLFRVLFEVWLASEQSVYLILAQVSCHDFFEQVCRLDGTQIVEGDFFLLELFCVLELSLRSE